VPLIDNHHSKILYYLGWQSLRSGILGGGRITTNNLTLQIIPFASHYSICEANEQYFVSYSFRNSSELDSFLRKTQKPQLSLRLYLWLSGRQDMTALDNQ
jgi:hypothetical protein